MKRISVVKSILLGMALSPWTGQAAVGTISGPLTHRNLQIFLVHGEPQLEGRRYATLSEGLTKGMVVVRETGNVQSLSVENVSKDMTVFLNAGDLLKGGRQDRTVRDDLILPPQSGPVSLATFCVERSRWTRRGEESAANFSANSKMLSSRDQKLAARYGQNQSDVWSGVTDQQMKLNANASTLAGKNVETRSALSSSSLQLTLENKDLEAVTGEYLGRLKSILDGKTDVIGFVYAINGEINDAEVYNNKSLFRALWPKLLDSAVTEAITEYRRDRTYSPVEARDLTRFFATALSGASQERLIWKSTGLRTYTTPSTVLFETLEVEADNLWLHKSFIHKGAQTVQVPLDREGLSRQSLQPRSIR